MLKLNLSVCGCTVSVTSRQVAAIDLLTAGYGAMADADPQPTACLCYSIRHDRHGLRELRRQGARPLVCSNNYELLYQFEKDLTLELQRLRPDLYFLHAGAVERDGRALLFAAPSGTGKSTLCYALLHQGFCYLSDELAPIDLTQLSITPYPHALCLKSPPPLPYTLPSDLIDTGRTLHIPTPLLPAPVRTTDCPLGAVLLIRRQAAPAPSPRRLSPAEAATRLYVNTLNALAHPGDGLDAALAITTRVPCYELDSSSLTGMGAILDTLLAPTV
jgi:hypothetical protein